MNIRDEHDDRVHVRRALLLGWILTAASGCAPPAEKAAERWLRAECAERPALALSGEPTSPLWTSPPSGQSSCASTKSRELDVKPCEAIAVGSTCEVAMKGRDAPLCLKRTADAEFKIDAGCSYGVSDSSVATIADKGIAAEAAIVLRGQLSLLDVEVRGYHSKHYFVGRLDDGGAGWLSVVAPRDTKNGKELYNLISDGKPHRATLLVSGAAPGELGHDETPPKNDVVEVIEASPGWGTPDRERSKRAAAAASLRRCCNAATHATHLVVGVGGESAKWNAAAAEKCAVVLDALLAGTTTNDAAVKEVLATYPSEKDWPMGCQGR